MGKKGKGIMGTKTKGQNSFSKYKKTERNAKIETDVPRHQKYTHKITAVW